MPHPSVIISFFSSSVSLFHKLKSFNTIPVPAMPINLTVFLFIFLSKNYQTSLLLVASLGQYIDQNNNIIKPGISPVSASVLGSNRWRVRKTSGSGSICVIFEASRFTMSLWHRLSPIRKQMFSDRQAATVTRHHVS